MRRNNTIKEYDKVYIDLPNMPLVRTLTACPLKTIYINRCADPWANIDRVFRTVEDLEKFCDKKGVELW